MKPIRPFPAKIVNHGEGIGTPTPELIRQRARELAAINGREQYSEEDWRAAKRELHGGHPEQNGYFDDMAESCSLGQPAIGSIGHKIEPMLDDENEHLAEELFAEGMDEAVHDQMYQASREREDDLEE